MQDEYERAWRREQRIFNFTIWTLASAGIAALVWAYVGDAEAQDGFRDPSKHAEHHEIYKTLHNQNGTHCCPIGDCRPTRAKFEDGNWYAMVNGEWRLMDPSRFVREYEYSWSDSPHVCEAWGNLYCFVRPNAGF